MVFDIGFNMRNQGANITPKIHIVAHNDFCLKIDSYGKKREFDFQVPWKAIIYAVVLFLAGSVLLVIGSLIVTGHLDPIEHNDRSQ